MADKSKTTREKLTPVQVENWRNYLAKEVGAYAFIMPEEDVRVYADEVQSKIDASTVAV